jgi:F-type H+-transporting ATPase subunit b
LEVRFAILPPLAPGVPVDERERPRVLPSAPRAPRPVLRIRRGKGASLRRSKRIGVCGVVLAGGVCAPATALAAGLNLTPSWPIVALNVGVFLLLVWPTNRFLLQPLVRVLEERERRTAGARAEAARGAEQVAALQQDLEARLRAARERAQARHAEITSAAQEETRRVLARAREEAAAEIESVRGAIAAEAEAARSALRADATALAREIAAKLLGREL